MPSIGFQAIRKCTPKRTPRRNRQLEYMIRYAIAFLFLPIIGLVMVSGQSPDHTVFQPKKAELEYAPL